MWRSYPAREKVAELTGAERERSEGRQLCRLAEACCKVQSSNLTAQDGGDRMRAPAVPLIESREAGRYLWGKTSAQLGREKPNGKACCAPPALANERDNVDQGASGEGDEDEGQELAWKEVHGKGAKKNVYL